MTMTELAARSSRRDTATYGAVSRLNHWVAAVLTVSVLAAGLTLEYAPLGDAAGSALRDWHKAVGVLVLGVGLWRLAWRVLKGFPPPVGAVPGWQEHLAKAIHWGLLAAIVAMPVSGILMTVFASRAVDVFGLATIPPATEVAWIAAAVNTAHDLGGKLLLALLALHAGAALKHHFLDRDATLVRMCSGRLDRQTAARPGRVQRQQG